MDFRICSFSCRGFNVCKLKHLVEILKKSDIVLTQESWFRSNHIGMLNC